MKCFAIPCHRGSHILWLMLVGCSAALLQSSTAIATDSVRDTSAEQLVESARQAELAGDTARYFALLHDAVRLAPDYQLARWQLGQVQVDGQWVAVEEAQRRAAADPKQDAYRRLRAESGESPAVQLMLARWCRSNGLQDEARFHWASVLSVDPNHKDALRALNMRWMDGQLIARDQIIQTKKDSSSTRRALRRWSASVATWERALSKKGDFPSSDVLDEIRAVSDPQAIPAFEQVTLSDAKSGAGRNEARRLLNRAFLDALDAMSDHAATESLVRHAVVSQWSDVRVEAIDRLRHRPIHDVAPLLLDGLVAPIESSFRVETDDNGSVHYLHTMYREGPFADWSHRVSHSIHQQAAPARIAARLAADDESSIVTTVAANSRTDAVSAAAAGRSARQYEQGAAAAEMQVAQANEATRALNARIVAVLSGVTDQSLGNEPREWWDWWQDQNEYYRSENRPVYETQDISNEYIVPPPQCECFARGTPVWTKTGQRPIETLELGDLVLAQNIDTGELNYKPIIGRTVRPPSEILTLSFGNERLRITRGHPLWVAGVGWRMAKELGDGAILHSVTGSQRIAAIEPSGQEEAYNLIVADCNTYFVGKSGVLVHDNTPRRPSSRSQLLSSAR